AARVMDEERRFPICRPDSLAALFIETGLVQVVVESVRIETVFRDFDDYWLPFLNGQAPAPRYVMSLSEAERYELRELLRARLPISSDGSIPLSTSSLLVRGRR
ncbi:MAG: SAM-dependent methyltransferase, partial [Chloroflexota bacterium]